MVKHVADLVKKCDTCQHYADVHLAPPAELPSLSALWPFSQWGIDLLEPFPLARGAVKYLIVAVDYFTKWVEAEPLAQITAEACNKFVKKNILTQLGISETIITDISTQFADKAFRELLKDLNIKYRFTSVEHPQTNGQAKAANKVILKGLKKRLKGDKGAWVGELPYVLWAYRTTSHSSTGETPFGLTYGAEVVIPVEIGEPT